MPHASGSVSGSESKTKWSLLFDLDLEPELELGLGLELGLDADPDPDADAELANLNSIPNGNRFGAAMSSSPWKILRNGDGDLATPFHPGKGRWNHGLHE